MGALLRTGASAWHISTKPPGKTCRAFIHTNTIWSGDTQRLWLTTSALLCSALLCCCAVVDHQARPHARWLYECLKPMAAIGIGERVHTLACVLLVSNSRPAHLVPGFHSTNTRAGVVLPCVRRALGLHSPRKSSFRTSLPQVSSVAESHITTQLVSASQ